MQLHAHASAFQITKQVQKYSFICYISDQVWWFNVKQLLSYSKNHICKFTQVIDNIINYFTSICPFESGNCGEEEKKLQRFEYLENEQSFLDE